MTSTGKALVVMKNVVVAVGLKMDTQKGSDERLLPAIAVKYVSIKINRGDLSIRLDGNKLTKLVSWFDVLFTGTICNEIESQLKSKLAETLPPKLNGMIRENDAYTTASFVESTQFITIDLSLAEPMKITPTTIEAGIKGIVFDSRY